MAETTRTANTDPGARPRRPSPRLRPGCNDLATVRPGLVAEWHPDRNGELEPTDVTVGSDRKVWWRCDRGHAWKATVKSRASDHGCPFCAGNQVLAGVTDLGTLRPGLVAEWHPELNGDLRPSDVTVGSGKKAWWRCSSGHAWKAMVKSRASGRCCPFCAGKQVLAGFNDLATRLPGLAAEWHPELNGDLRPSDVTVGSHKMAWWRCSSGHAWKAAVADRSAGRGCPVCAGGWGESSLVALIESLVFIDADGERRLPSLPEFLTIMEGRVVSPAARRRAAALFDRYLGAGTAGGLLSLIRQETEEAEDAPGAGGEDWPDGEPVGEGGPGAAPEGGDGPGVPGSDGAVDGGETPGGGTGEESAGKRIEDILAKVDKAARVVVDMPTTGSSDEESLAFLVQNAVDQLWKVAYRDGDLEAAFAAYPNGPYSTRVLDRFRAEYRAAQRFEPGPEWSFRPGPGAEVAAPNLMQRHFATLVAARPFVGNWSGTGAGKTVGAVAGAVAAGAGTILVFAPNNVLDGWAATIVSCLPSSQVRRSLDGEWGAAAGRRWLVVNYETLSTRSEQLLGFVERERPDMVVFDEAQFVKIRSSGRRSHDSRRAQAARDVRALAAAVNPQLRVLAMTATPVVNDLSEARSQLELLLGEQMDDLPVSARVSAAVKVHRQLVTSGIRHLPDYSRIGVEEVHFDIDGTRLLAELAEVAGLSAPQAERILFAEKIDPIVELCVDARRGAGASGRGRTLIYTELVDGVVDPLVAALRSAGLGVAVHTGERKEIEAFLAPGSELDVLVASNTLQVGVDGLQHAVDQVVFAVLPWTPAAFEQVRGRVVRQGRVDGRGVKVVVPHVVVEVEDDDGNLVRRSLDRRRWSFVTSKTRLVELAVDGRIDHDHDELIAGYDRWVSEWVKAVQRGGAIRRLPRRPLPVGQARCAS